MRKLLTEKILDLLGWEVLIYGKFVDHGSAAATEIGDAARRFEALADAK